MKLLIVNLFELITVRIFALLTGDAQQVLNDRLSVVGF